MTNGRDLEPLFAPRSVAVLGASTDPSKWGNWLARNVLRGAHRRPVHLINRRGGEIDGHPLLASLADAGGSNLKEIGELLNVSKERVRQIEVRALISVRRNHPPHE